MSERDISSPLTNCENMLRECSKKLAKKCDSESNLVHKREKKHVLPHHLDKYKDENNLAADFSAEFASGYSTVSERNISSPLTNCENMVLEGSKKSVKKCDSISERNPVHKREKKHVLPHQLDKYKDGNTRAADFSAAFASGYSSLSERNISSPLTNCENMVPECSKKSAMKCDSIAESNPVHKREKKHVLLHQLDKYKHENTLAANFSAALVSGNSTPSEQGLSDDLINPFLFHQIRNYNHENTLADDFSAAIVHESCISSQTESIKKMEKPLPHQMNAYRHEETLFTDLSAVFVSGNTTSDNMSFHQHLPHQLGKYQHENSLSADISSALAHTNYSEPSMMLDEKIHLPHLMSPRASDGFSFQLVENYTETIDESSSYKAEQTMCNNTSQVEEVENNSGASNFKNSLFSDSSVEPVNTGEYSIDASFAKFNYTYTLRKDISATDDSFKYEPASRTYLIHSSSVCSEVQPINCEDAMHVSCLQVKNHELCAPETSFGSDQDKLSLINNIQVMSIDNVKEEKTLSASIVHNNNINEGLKRIFDEDMPLNDCSNLVASEIENGTESHVYSNNYNLVLHDNPNKVTGTESKDTNDERFEDMTSDAGFLVQESHAPCTNVSGNTNEESGNKSEVVVVDTDIENVQEKDPEDTNDEHFNDVAEDDGFNDEWSHILSINEGSRNKSTDEGLGDGLKDVHESHITSLNESENRNERYVSKNNSGDIVLDGGIDTTPMLGDINEGARNKSKDVALHDGIDNIQENELEDTNDEHNDDVARDVDFNNEGSHVMSISEGSRNKSVNEALDEYLNGVQEGHTPPLNESRNRNEMHVSPNISGDIVFDEGSNDVAMSINKSGYTKEGSGNRFKDVTLDDDIENDKGKESEDKINGHFEDVARDTVFNVEGSNTISVNESRDINERSKNKSKHEAVGDSLNSVQKNHTFLMSEITIEELENKSKDVVLNDGVEDIQENELQDTNDEYFDGVVRDAGFNDERSHLMAINEGSRIKSNNEDLVNNLNGVQEGNTPPLNESINRCEERVSENKSGDILLDNDLNDVALSVNKSQSTNEKHTSKINFKNVALVNDDVNGIEESPQPPSIAISISKKNLSAEEKSKSVSQNDCSEGNHASSPIQSTNCDKSKSDFDSLYPNNSKRKRTSNINTDSYFATLVKSSVTATQVSEPNNFADFLFNSSESTEKSPLSRNIDVEPMAPRRKEIIRKRSDRLLDLEDDVTEPLPKKPSFPKFDAYEGPEFYKLLIEKMESKYGIKTNKEVVAVAKYISETVQQVIKEKNRDVYIPIINEMKVVLARKQVVRTNWEFYEFCMRRLPSGFKVKAIPSYNPISAPFEPDTIFEAILEE